MAGFKPGDLICVSKPFSYVLFDEIRGQRCDYCFSKYVFDIYSSVIPNLSTLENL